VMGAICIGSCATEEAPDVTFDAEALDATIGVTPDALTGADPIGCEMTLDVAVADTEIPFGPPIGTLLPANDNGAWEGNDGACCAPEVALLPIVPFELGANSG
jgi:hypothetical protein